MAQPPLERFAKRNMLLKIETTEGVDSNPVGATDGFRLIDGESSTEVDTVEFPVDSDFFRQPEIQVSNRRGIVEGTFRMLPPATPGAASTSDAHSGVMLQVAGFAVTKDSVNKITRYNPVSSGIPSATAHWHQAGLLKKLLGSRADLSDIRIAINEAFTGRARLQGDYTEVVKAVAPVVTYPNERRIPVGTARRMRAYVSTLERGGTKTTESTPLDDLLVRAKFLSVNLGNELAHKEYSSLSVNSIDNRQATWSLQIAKTDISDDFNPWFVRDNGIFVDIRVRLFNEEGATQDSVLTGLYSELGIRGQIESISEDDIESDYGWTLTGRCIPSDTGGDELWIAFGDED